MDTGEKGNPKDDPKSYVDGVKLPYTRILQFNKPQKNDVVVFNYPQDSVHTAIDRKDPYVKRCVATAGDTFEMRAGRLFVNGKAGNCFRRPGSTAQIYCNNRKSVRYSNFIKLMDFYRFRKYSRIMEVYLWISGIN
jgi:signal peptidase I